MVPTETKSELTARIPFGWIEAILLAVLALVGFDILFNWLLGFMVGLSQAFYGADNALTRLAENNAVVVNFVLFASARLTALVWLYSLMRRRGKGWSDLGLQRFPWLKSSGLITIAAGVFLFASYRIFTLLDQVAPGLDLEQEQEIVFTAASNTPELVLSAVALIVIAPVVEEIIFRGILLPVFIKRFGMIAAAVITSLLFGLVHLQLNVFIVTFVLGLLLAWLYYRTLSLWPAIILHSLKNLVAFLVIFGLF